MRRVVPVLAVAALAACPEPGPWAGALPRPVKRCPDADSLGTPGAFAQEAIPFTWQYDAASGLSWAEPITRRVQRDTTGLAVTVDGGAERTAVGWMALGGRMVVDLDAEGRFGKPARRAADTDGTPVIDTFETGIVGGGDDTGFVDTSPVAGLEGTFDAPLFHGPGFGATVALPMHGRSRPRAGCLAVLPIAAGVDLSGQSGELVVSTKRTPVTRSEIALDVVIVQGTSVTQNDLTPALDVMADLYARGGAGPIVDIRRREIFVQGGAFLPQGGEGAAALRETLSATAEPGRVMIVVTEDFLDNDGTLGIAAGIPGAVGTRATPGAGVLVSVAAHRVRGGDLDADTLGETLAHEVGHQIGLFHSTEAGGDSFDILGDTPECRAERRDRDGDGTVTAEECAQADGTNVMFWTSGNARQDVMSRQQADVLRRSVVAGALQEVP